MYLSLWYLKKLTSKKLPLERKKFLVKYVKNVLTEKIGLNDMFENYSGELFSLKILKNARINRPMTLTIPVVCAFTLVFVPMILNVYF